MRHTSDVGSAHDEVRLRSVEERWRESLNTKFDRVHPAQISSRPKVAASHSREAIDVVQARYKDTSEEIDIL